MYEMSVKIGRLINLNCHYYFESRYKKCVFDRWLPGRLQLRLVYPSYRERMDR